MKEMRTPWLGALSLAAADGVNTHVARNAATVPAMVSAISADYRLRDEVIGAVATRRFISSTNEVSGN